MFINEAYKLLLFSNDMRRDVWDMISVILVDMVKIISFMFMSKLIKCQSKQKLTCLDKHRTHYFS